MNYSRLLNDSIISPTVSTPKINETRTSRLKWTDKTPLPLKARLLSDTSMTNLSDVEESHRMTDSPPARHIVCSKGKSPVYVLAKPKIRTF